MASTSEVTSSEISFYTPHLSQRPHPHLVPLWPNYGLGGGTDGTGRGGKRKAAVVLVLLAKDVVSLQINTEIGKS